MERADEYADAPPPKTFTEIWARVEIDALVVGVSLDYFWGDITPKKYKMYVKAYQRRLEDRMYSTDITNHILGLYIRTAIGDALSGTNHYPEKSVMEKAKEPKFLKKVFTPEQTEAYLKAQAKNES